MTQGRTLWAKEERKGKDKKRLPPTGVKGPEAHAPRVSFSLSPLSSLGPHHFILRAHLKMSRSEEGGRKMALIGQKVPGAVPSYFIESSQQSYKETDIIPFAKKRYKRSQQGR